MFDSFSLFLLMLANKTHTSQAGLFQADLRAFRASILPYPAQLIFSYWSDVCFSSRIPSVAGVLKVCKDGELPVEYLDFVRLAMRQRRGLAAQSSMPCR